MDDDCKSSEYGSSMVDGNRASEDDMDYDYGWDEYDWAGKLPSLVLYRCGIYDTLCIS